MCVYITTMGAETAAGIQAKLGGDVQVRGEIVISYGFLGSGSGGDPWGHIFRRAPPVRPREKFAELKL